MSLNLHTRKANTKYNFKDIEKYINIIQEAALGLKCINLDHILDKLDNHITTKINNKDIIELLVKLCADEISLKNPDYQILAARIALYSLRNQVWKSQNPPKFYDHISRLCSDNIYDKNIIKKYSREEIEFLDQHIDHEKDRNFTYAGITQMMSKYLLQNKITGQIYETPQMAYMAMSMTIHINEQKVRIDKVINFYKATSEFLISVPTPILAGARSALKSFSSCTVLNTGDSLNSISHTTDVIIKHISKRAGIGVNIGRIRSLGAPIRNGQHIHTGIIPFLKVFAAAVKCCSQGGIRSGAATFFYPIWHREVEDLLVLKNNRGSEENRIRNIDYAVQINKFFYKRLINGQDITLFCPNDVPDLYEAFFKNQELFEKLYIKYENSYKERSKTVKAVDIFTTIAQERAQTGRLYIQNVDHCNEKSSFIETEATVYGSNLCMEITLPSYPEKEISLCTLGAINVAKIKNDTQLKDCCYMIVRALDNIIDYQTYNDPISEKSNKSRRPLGIGITSFAEFLAKNKLKYDDTSANKKTHELMEKFQYYLIEASVALSEEKGSCVKFSETKYSKGIMPVDKYEKNIDTFANFQLSMNWDKLRHKVVAKGMRNSTLSAIMPCESSSIVLNATNGIEPPRGYMSIKASKEGYLTQLVPGYDLYGDSYQTLWDMKSNKGYLQICAIIQKFIDQAISVNTNYNPYMFENNKVPTSLIVQEIILAYQYGLKTMYYHNTKDQNSQAINCSSCTL